jgi:conjugative transfer pilus assembly protein TraH
MHRRLRNLPYKLIIVILFCIPAVCNADWADDWIRQKSVYGGGSYSGQDRGFMYGGNASLRYQPSKDYLVTLTPPNFRNGCGGIDLFMGGFSFLKSQELIEKFKNIMGPAAISFAFDIALETLCPQCASTMKDLENLANKLNQMQLDDCKAQKAVVTIAKDATGLGGAVDKEAISDFMISSGLKDSYEAVKNFGMTSSSEQIKQEAPKKDMTQGCPKEVKELFFTQGTLIENISDSMDTRISGYTSLIRSIIGDVRISHDLDYTFIAPCPDNSDVSIDSIMTGNLYVKTSDSNKCIPCNNIMIDGRSYNSILDWCEYELGNITDSIINRSQLPESTLNFLNSADSFRISAFLQKRMIELGQNFNKEKAVTAYAPVVARWYTWQMMRDLLIIFDKAVQMAVQTSLNKKGSDSPDSESCQINLKDEAFVMLSSLKKNLSDKLDRVDAEYNKKANLFFNSLNTLSDQQRQLNQLKKGGFNKINDQLGAQ